MHKISLVVPVYNEEDTIDFFLKEVEEKLNKYNVEIIFINDGSKDNTLNLLNNLALEDERIVLVNLSRNFGKEHALFAGLNYVSGDAVIPIDVDLQDPIEVIHEMIKKWEEGFDVVLGKRIDRSEDHKLKRLSAEMFYKLHNLITDRVKIEENVGDFRLMDKRVVKHVISLKERNLFMKGLLSWVGFKTTIVEYARKNRSAGTTKFNAFKLWNLAVEGITSFSSMPLKVWSYLGFSISFLAFLYAIFIVFQKIFLGNPIPGYPSLLVSILFMGGTILMGIGALGEYIGRIYIEVKQRPQYIVSDIIRDKKSEKL